MIFQEVFMSSPIGSKRSVKIFVLYLMENINYPLDFYTINDIVMQTDFVMYLDFAESFNEMLDADLIASIKEDEDEYFYVTDKGRIVAQELKSDVLSSILDQSLAAAFRYLDFSRRGITVSCEVIPRKDGTGKCDVKCAMMEKKKVIFEATLTVDSENRAKRMKENFDSRPEVIYRGFNALMAGQVNYLFD